MPELHRNVEGPLDLQAALPMLLPRAIAWAEAQANAIIPTGNALSREARRVARNVGVQHPELIRLALVEILPSPEDPLLKRAAIQAGLVGSNMTGLTLGYSVFVRRGYDTWRLLSHEFRHVFQYEQAGSIAAFLPVYLQQIVKYGYASAPLERDAREHEQHAP